MEIMSSGLRRLSTLKTRIVGIILLILLIVAGFWLLRMYEIPTPQGWKAEMKNFTNPIVGFSKVVDSESGNTLFYYSDDPVVYPSQIEKISDDEWRVIFKKRKE